MFGERALGGRLLFLNLYLSPAPLNLDLKCDKPILTLVDITAGSPCIRNVVHQGAVEDPHLRLAAVVVPRLLVVFDVDVAAVVDHTTTAPMVQPPTHLIEHRDSNRSLLRLLQD